MEKSKSSLLSSSMLCVRQMVLRVGFKFKLATARVRTPRPSRLLMALLAGCGLPAAMALPSGGQVASGNVTIAAPAGNTLNITQTTDKGVINWQSFNVGSGEKVNFQQPGATSSTLNRVIGSDPSSIFGQINANGQVFLINNSGILFAPGAQVNAAGLVASTLQLADADYLAGNYVLSGAGGSVANQGVLKAGFVALAGSQVSNTGTIVADGGTAALAAGDRVTLNLIGNDLVSMSVDAPTAAALVHAGGIVQADGGQVLITAKAADALLGTVVNVDGIVQAHSMGSRNGVITLDGGNSGVVAVSGTLDASGKAAGATGGTVKVTGADVGLFDHASVDVSGDAGGGVVRIGGDWHGAGADGDANASQVFAGANSTIAADAISSGRGGNVVLWSNDRTVAAGAISARGGADSGDGGAIETSSHRSLQAVGAVDASAAHGRAGQWLIDPSEITISTASNSVGGNGSSGNPFTDTTAPSILNTTTLHNALNTADVTVTTSGASGGDGVITVDGAVTSKNNGNSSLTLNASSAIDFTSNGSIAPGGTGNLAVTLVAGAGGVTMDAAASISTGPSGALSVSTTGAVSLSSLTVGNGSSAANLTISAGGAVTQTAAWSVADGTTKVTTTSGDITLTGANTFSTFEAHDSDAAGNVSVTTGGALVLAGVDDNAGGALGGGLTVNAGGAVSQTAAIKVAGTTAVTTSAGNIDLTGSGSNSIATFAAHDAAAAGNVSITTGGALALGGVDNGSSAALGGGLTVSAGGTVSQVSSTALKVAGTTTVTTSAGDITLANANTIAKFAAHDADAAGNVSITTGGALALGSVDNGSSSALGGGLTVNAGGTVSQIGSTALKVAGTTAVTTSAGDIGLTNANTIATFTAHDSAAAGNVSVTTGGALALGNVDNNTGGALGGGLTVDAGGTVSQVSSTALQVAGTTAVTTSAGDIGLANANTIATFAAHDADAAGNVSVTTGGALALGNVDNNTGGALGGGLTVSAGGTVSQANSTALKVAGTTAVTTSAGDIGLTNANTIATFTAHDSAAAGNVSITTGGALALGNVDNNAGGALGGGLTVDAGGTVSQVSSTALQVAGTTAVTTSAGDIGLTNANTIATFAAHDSAAAGNVSITTGGALALGSVDNNAGGALGGGLTVNAGGTVSQVSSTALKVAGTTAVTTSAGDITLANANTIAKFAAHDAAAAGNVSITTGGVLALGNVDNNAGGALGGSLTVDAGGTVSQVGSTALQVAGTTAVTTSAGDITLTNANTIATFAAHDSAAAGNVSVTTGGALALGSVDNNAGGSLGGGLTVDAGGTVSQVASTALKVAGTTAVTTSAGDITLANANSVATFTAHDAAAAGNVSIKTGGALALGNVDNGSSAALGGGLTASAGGNLSQATGTRLLIGGATSATTTSGNVTLANTGNTFGGGVSATGTSIDIAATGALQASASLTGGTGDLTLAATGALSGVTAVATSGNITLSSGAALTTGGTLGGHDISLTGTAVTLQNDVVASNNLTVNATAGAINQTAGTASALGTTTLTAAGAGNSIALNDVANNFGGAVSVSGDAVSLTDSGALTVNGTTTSNLTVTGSGVTFGPGVTQVGGVLSVNAGAGAIAQAGQVSVAGTTTLATTGAGTVTLADPTNVFTGAVTATASSIDIGAAGNLSVTPNMPAGTGNLTLAAYGATAALSIPGGAISTTGDVSLTAGGGLSTSGDITARNVSLGGGALVIGNHIAASGTFDATSTSTITETAGGVITAVGATTLDAGANAITLGTSSNNFGSVSATGGAVTIADADALTVHLTSATRANLTAGTGGAGALTVDGTTSAGDLVLAGKGIVFGSGSTTVHGNLSVSSGGTISQVNNLVVTGASTLDAGSNDILLHSALNDFGGAVTATGGLVAISDINALTVHLVSASTAGLQAGGLLTVDGSDAGMLQVDGNGISFGTTSAGTILATGNNGAITQTGAVSTTSASSITTTGQDVTLTNGGNNLQGNLTVGGANVAVTTAGALIVNGSASGNLALSGAGVDLAATVGGALSVASSGQILGGGAVQIAGASTLNAGSSDITIVQPGSHFGGLVTATGGVIDIADSAALSAHLASATSANLTAAGALAVDGATTGDLTASGASVSLGATTVGGTLTAAASTGAITQTGAVAVAGAGQLTANSGAITLANPNNDFGGLVTATAGAAVNLADVNALSAHVGGASSATLAAGGVLTVDGSTTGALQAAGNGVVFGPGATSVGGVLTASSGTGTITQTGSLSVAGASTLDAGGNAIALTTAANDFGGAVTASGSTVSLVDANALTAHVTSSGDATLNAAGLLSVDGTSGGGLSASGSGVVLGTTHVTGTFAASSGTGTITQTGALTVGGASTLAAGTAAITLTNAANDFGGPVSATGGAVGLTDANALVAHLAAASATLNAGGVLTVDGGTTGALTADGNGVVFGATTVGGNLAAASGSGTITQTGALTAAGTSTLNAGGNAITLTKAGNDFGGAVTATGGAVTLADANALAAHVTAANATLTAAGALAVDGSTTGALAATGAGIAFGPASTTVHGTLTATSTGAVTQSGDVAVTGATTISAAGQNVTLARQTDQFAGGVTVAAAAVDIEQAGALTVNLNDVGSAVAKSGAALALHGSSTGNVTASGATVTLGGSVLTVGGNLAATSSAGDITQAGTLSVAGTSTLAAGTGNVTLADSANALVGAVTASGANITLADASPLTAHIAANGSATLTSAGALSVDGSAGALNLTGTSVDFGAAGTTVNGALTTNGGGVTQAGNLAVTGLSTFNAGSGDILLDSPGTNLQGAITATGHAIRLADTHAIDATLNAAGDVVLSSSADVRAGGSIGGGLKVTGAKVSLDQGSSAQPMAVGGLLDVASSGDTSLGYVTANGAQVTAGGTLLLDGTLKSAAGDVTLKAAAIQGVSKLGALDVAAGSKVALDTSGTGGGSIGKATTSTGVIDDNAIIKLLGATGQSGLNVNFSVGQSAWFRVGTQAQTHLLQPHQFDFLAAKTFFCDLATCVNVLGQTTAIADSVIANILTAASQDAADAAFGTENLDFAIRKGYVTTIGRVPPGIDEIAGDLGATPCDSRVTSPTAIAADKACK